MPRSESSVDAEGNILVKLFELLLLVSTFGLGFRV